MRPVRADPAIMAIYCESAAHPSGVEGRQMSDVPSIVFVVDDDVSVRESLELLLRAAGWQSETFASALAFLSRPRPTVPCCLVLDVTLPGLSGLELQQQLAERTDMPIIFITGHGDVPMTVQAMKAGAVEFLTKPFTQRRAAGRHRRRHRAQSHRGAPGGGHATSAELLRVTHATRTRGDGVGRLGSVEQAGRWRTWHQRDHGQGAPRSDDAQDEGRLSSRAGHHGRETRPATCAKGLTVTPICSTNSRIWGRRTTRCSAATGSPDGGMKPARQEFQLLPGVTRPW